MAQSNDDDNFFAAYQKPFTPHGAAKKGKGDDDFFAAYQTPLAAPAEPDFTVKTKDQAGEGLYKMTRDGTEFKDIPYSNVMKASGAGYRMQPDVRETYAKDRRAEVMKGRPFVWDEGWFTDKTPKGGISEPDYLKAMQLPEAVPERPGPVSRVVRSVEKGVQKVTEPTTTPLVAPRTATDQFAVNAAKRVGRVLFGIPDMAPQAFSALSDSLSHDPVKAADGFDRFTKMINPTAQVMSRWKELKDDWHRDPSLAASNVAGDLIGIWLAGKAMEIPQGVAKLGSAVKERVASPGKYAPDSVTIAGVDVPVGIGEQIPFSPAGREFIRLKRKGAGKGEFESFERRQQQAIKDVIRKTAQQTSGLIGPVSEEGWYYSTNRGEPGAAVKDAAEITFNRARPMYRALDAAGVDVPDTFAKTSQITQTAITRARKLGLEIDTEPRWVDPATGQPVDPSTLPLTQAEIDARVKAAQPVEERGKPADIMTAAERERLSAESGHPEPGSRALQREAVSGTSRSGEGANLEGTVPEGSSYSYDRRVRRDGESFRVLGAPVRETWSLNPAKKAELKSEGYQSPDIHELAPNSPESVEAFHSAISKTEEGNKYAASVRVYSPEEYAHVRLFLSEDGKAGFGLKPDGDIVSLFVHGDGPKGASHTMLEIAKQSGGLKMDCFDTVLPKLYGDHGFRAVARMAWDNEYSPESWDKKLFGKYNSGEPDVVFMALDPQAGPYRAGDGKLVTDYNEAVRLQGEAVQSARREPEEDIGTLRSRQRGPVDGPLTQAEIKARERAGQLSWESPATHPLTTFMKVRSQLLKMQRLSKDPAVSYQIGQEIKTLNDAMDAALKGSPQAENWKEASRLWAKGYALRTVAREIGMITKGTPYEVQRQALWKHAMAGERAVVVPESTRLQGGSLVNRLNKLAENGVLEKACTPEEAQNLRESASLLERIQKTRVGRTAERTHGLGHVLGLGAKGSASLGAVAGWMHGGWLGALIGAAGGGAAMGGFGWLQELRENALAKAMTTTDGVEALRAVDAAKTPGQLQVATKALARLIAASVAAAQKPTRNPKELNAEAARLAGATPAAMPNQPQPATKPSAVHPDTGGGFARAISNREGFGQPNTIPTKANNPGALELGNIGYGTLKAANGQRITVFRTQADGWKALNKQLNLILSGNSPKYPPTMTLKEAFKKYGGGDAGYGATIAAALGVDPSTTLGELARRRTPATAAGQRKPKTLRELQATATPLRPPGSTAPVTAAVPQ